MKNKSNLNLSNPFSFDRKNLILTVGAIVKDFHSKLSIEPNLDVNKYNISQDIMDYEKDFKKKLIAEDDHNKPIFVMGAVGSFRKYPVLRSIYLSENEFKRYTDISFGNLFTTTLKSKIHGGIVNNDMIEEDEAQEVESVFVFETNEEESEENRMKVEQSETSNKLSEDSEMKDVSEELKTGTADQVMSDNGEIMKKKKGIKKRKSAERNENNKTRKVNKSVSQERKQKVKAKKKYPVQSLCERLQIYYLNNGDLTRKIKYEILNIAGDLRLQRKLKE